MTHQPPPGKRAPAGAVTQSNAQRGTFGLIIVLVGITVAFGWLIYGYLIVRRDFPHEQVTLPVWLWFSTFVVLVSSVTLQSSLVPARMNIEYRLRGHGPVRRLHGGIAARRQQVAPDRFPPPPPCRAARPWRCRVAGRD